MKTPQELDTWLDTLYEKGAENDRQASHHREMMLNITPETGRFLAMLVDGYRPNRILEIGTSNGYSTLWLARAAKTVRASIDTVEFNPAKVRMAVSHFAESGFEKTITVQMRDAGDYLASCEDNHFDFVFLDSDRGRYQDWSDDLLRVLDFGVMVIDNAVSHPEELIQLRERIDSESDLESVTLPIGNGQLVVTSRWVTHTN
ncbi:MAG: class I SAM-dependent methyltransferase [Planctomycetota bacterium]